MVSYNCILCLCGGLVSVFLLTLGVLLIKLPFTHPGDYDAGQWLSCIAQGIAICAFSSASFLENVTSFQCIASNCGFLTTIVGRGVYYILIGLFSMPIWEQLRAVSESSGSEAWAAGIALTGVILSIFVGILHLCLWWRMRRDARIAKEVPEPAPALDKQTLGRSES